MDKEIKDKEALKWLGESSLSYDIWNNKYRQDNESFEEWLNRISNKDARLKKLIFEKKFIFGGRILANRGLDKKGKKITLSNCYVISSPEDNLESIFETATKLARTYSYGGGCGVDVSKLRPRNSKVNNAAKSTSGCTSFMDFYSYVTGLIGQEGRRGALMLSIDCTHPDLEEFINLKSDLNKCTKANISVKVSNDFMKAVEENSTWKLSFNNGDELIEKIVNAREIFKLLAQRNWEMAEPGILYWDNICNYNMLDKDPNFSYASTNPCAEEPLPAGGSCLLGSINLSEFVINPFTENAKIDFDALEDTVAIAIGALNDVLIEGMLLHPLKEQKDSVYNWRQIGLGTMGLGDMLIKLGITYGSTESLNTIDTVFKSIATVSVMTSLELARVHGCYPMCNKEAVASSSFITNIGLPTTVIDDIKKYGLYNSQLLTCAPTGSIGTMLGCSTGVEPNFAFEFNRRTVSLNKEETTYKVYAKIVEDYCKAKGIDNDAKAKSNFLPSYFVSSQQIDPFNRIKVQSHLQKYIDASISSTINLPEETTVEQVYDIYFEAWKQGLKGVTIYRDNCQRQGILTTKEVKKSTETSEQSNANILPRGFIVKADDSCIGLKRTLVTGCGTLHCTAYFDPVTGDLRETYLSKGSTGGCNNFMIGLSRMISLAARGGIKLDDILDQLKSCGTCSSYAVRTATKHDTSKGSCCPVAVGNALKDMHIEMKKRIFNPSSINNKISIDTKDKKQDSTSSIQNSELQKDTIKDTKVNSLDGIFSTFCPECGGKLIHSGGCTECIDCGWTKCE